MRSSDTTFAAGQAQYQQLSFVWDAHVHYEFTELMAYVEVGYKILVKYLGKLTDGLSHAEKDRQSSSEV